MLKRQALIMSLGQNLMNTTRRLSRVSSYLWAVTQQLTCLFMQSPCCQILLKHIHTQTHMHKSSKIACWYATGCTARIYEVPSVSVLRKELYSMMLVYDFISFPYDAKWRHLGWFQISSYLFVLSQLSPIFLWSTSLSQFLCAQLVDFNNTDISAMTVYLYTNSKYKGRDLTQVNFHTWYLSWPEDRQNKIP